MDRPVTSATFRSWARACADALGAARAEIDALNVFPVADSDTGTNVYVTLEAAAQAAEAAADAGRPLDAMVKEYLDALLLGARGNSGVILAQLLRAAIPAIAAGPQPAEARVVADAMQTAADAAYRAVGRPVEGTILSVAAAAADAAREAADAGQPLDAMVSAAAAEARRALARTPHQLELLAAAGVVDAGGRALVVLYDTTERFLTGRFAPAAEPVAFPPPPQPSADLHAGGPAYEVMYLLEAVDDRIERLRTRLDSLGDSLVVVGGDGLWNVHVHVDDPGAAIEAGIAAGRPYRIEVTHFAEQTPATSTAERTRAVVAVAAGDGLAALFSEAGAVVVECAVGAALALDRVLDTVLDCGADDVVVLPNSRDHLRICDAVAAQAREAGVHATVLPSHTQVQGLAALAVHDPARPFDDDVVAMTSAAAHTQHGAITIATEDGITMAGPCRVGDVLGVVDAEFAAVGAEQAEVVEAVLERLVSGSAELVTLVTGEGLQPDLPERIESWLRERRPDVDVVVYDGRQARYPLLVAVE
ncbi:hypothetical protein CLV56_3357 [Mumia flava]|uniref:DhaL domain-containing protein n=1 Tax=Mumia flava TaxID=1348852 RepID=A0A0B2B648_9ACTN|nr:DAK2 domain-containing protein [Mumia flava]PJJ53857.1 hypothetical protein CLV56_3357 [Mumia flava]